MMHTFVGDVNGKVSAPLHVAAENDDLDLTRRLLDAKANVDPVDEVRPFVCPDSLFLSLSGMKGWERETERREGAKKRTGNRNGRSREQAKEKEKPRERERSRDEKGTNRKTIGTGKEKGHPRCRMRR